MGYPTVSIIVLNYNGLQYMEDCFGSLNQLEYPADRMELVLADNASSDGSVEFVRERFGQVRIIEFDRNYGFCGGNNRAVAQSQSEYVALLNSDMRVEPEWLTGLIKALGDEPEVVCSASKILTWDGRAIDFGGLLVSFLGHGKADGYLDTDLAAYDDLRYILGPCGGAMLIKRQVFQDIGGFDEDFFAYFDDIDLGWRLWILGYKVVYAPKSICYHIHYGSSSKLPQAQVLYLYERNALYTIIKNYEQRYLDRVLPLALFLQFKRAYLHGEMSGIDMDKYRFGLVAPDPLAPPPIRYDTRYYLQEAWQTLRDEGVSGLGRKVSEELERRRGNPIAKFVPPELASRQQPHFGQQQAGLAAMNDVMDNYATLLEKRARIQERRRRTDQEIFQTVRALSFDVSFDTAEYRQTQQRLMDLFAIQDLFGEIFDPDIPFASGSKKRA